MHKNVRRLIHSWPYYQFGLDVTRACKVVGVDVKIKETAYVSQRCPECGHTEKDNVRYREFRADAVNVFSEDGKQSLKPDGMQDPREQVYFRFDKRTVFTCQACELSADADYVACANHLADKGVRVSIRHMMTDVRNKKIEQQLKETA